MSIIRGAADTLDSGGKAVTVSKDPSGGDRSEATGMCAYVPVGSHLIYSLCQEASCHVSYFSFLCPHCGMR